MIYVICVNKVKEENLNNFLEAAISHANTSISLDKGCISFDILEYDKQTEEIIFVEKWNSQEDLDNHSKRCKESLDIPKINKNRYSKSMKVYNILR